LIVLGYDWNDVMILTLCAAAIIFACRSNLKEFFTEKRTKGKKQGFGEQAGKVDESPDRSK
jgi:hypothetical protein